MAKEKILRSFIQEHFPFEFRVESELLSRRRDVTLSEKQSLILKLLRDYDIGNVVPLGPGTNRYAFKLEGFVVKVATDREGRLDNMNEFKMTTMLPPDTITRTYEVSTNGNLLIAEYAQVFVSWSEFLGYRDQIEEKLSRLSKMGYLVGDVGIIDKNYTNWGIRVGTKEPVILDYAYTYDINSEQLVCQKCNAHVLMNPSANYAHLVCPACKQVTQFQDLRRRIGTQEHINRIGNLEDIGYTMREASESKKLDEQRSIYLRTYGKPAETKIIQEEETPLNPEAFVVNKEDKSMSWKDTVVAHDPNLGTTPIRLANVNRVIIAHDPGEPPVDVTPRNSMYDVDPGDFNIEGFENQPDVPEPMTTEDESDQDDKVEEKHLVGTMDIRIYNESGYTRTDVCFPGVTIPIYGPMLKVAEKAHVYEKPYDWSFFKHFEPHNFFYTDHPEVFEGTGNPEDSIILVKIKNKGEGAIFGIYGLASVVRVTEDGSEITLSAADREKRVKAVGYAINAMLSKSGALTISRFDINCSVPDSLLINEKLVYEICESEGIKLNPKKEEVETDDDGKDLSSVGSDVLTELYEQSETMRDSEDPDNSSFNPNAEYHDEDVETVESDKPENVEVMNPVTSSPVVDPNMAIPPVYRRK